MYSLSQLPLERAAVCIDTLTGEAGDPKHNQTNLPRDSRSHQGNCITTIDTILLTFVPT